MVICFDDSSLTLNYYDSCTHQTVTILLIHSANQSIDWFLYDGTDGH